MTLYTKYRPTSFHEIVGNKLAIQALKSALEKTNHSHVYLFTGPSGTGKTTTARIVANMLGADELDIKEINSSNNRGIDTAREIQQRMGLIPMSGCTVYIIDEIQKTTSDFQNAMLKPFEDTPDYVYFILCTTDPQKLIKPLKTRCTEVKFELLSSDEISKIIIRVNDLESIGLSNNIIEEIADKSEGCPRKALVLLERIASLGTEKEQLQYIKSNILEEDDTEIIELCRALLDDKNKWNSIATILKKLNIANKLDDPEQVRYAVLGYMNAVLLNGKMNDRAIKALEAFSENTYNNGKSGITLACLSAII